MEDNCFTKLCLNFLNFKFKTFKMLCTQILLSERREDRHFSILNIIRHFNKTNIVILKKERIHL